MANFVKAETALNRAEGSINVGQKEEAFKGLHDLIASRKFKSWQNSLEKLMFLYVELCVDLGRGWCAKDGLKFLFEAYETVLEILKNNSRLEGIYAATARSAFQFCRQHNQATEFRRLCETIRSHLAIFVKYSEEQKDNRHWPDLSVPETLQFYLDTRFEQLNVATELHLWEEAFRSVEDIHGLMSMVGKTPKASLMVLALSVPPYGHHSHCEKEKNLKMASIIRFDVEQKSDSQELLSRGGLFAELESKGVISCVTHEVKDLYHLLEDDEFVPLDLAAKRKHQNFLEEKEDRKKEETQLLQKKLEERQEEEKNLQKLFKTEDHLERAKREEFRAAFEQRILVEATSHEREQQQEIELSRQRHAGDLEEKSRLVRMLENRNRYQERVVGHREAEFNRMRNERQDELNRLIQAPKKFLSYI
ncbi:OLC1v1001647C1 [Oldenlandia corymbosa var. corymbosa]|uniref:OLC1v1001647C1 n=1 Tax=Oldenlandia corymbosa var. corymbosa TaxID=529605 RepID=A0AAV1D6X4_OLDCO|nr:OLC1v1001647C1 [Oldenlandia corymbosa var. corymbosa]